MIMDNFFKKKIIKANNTHKNNEQKNLNYLVTKLITLTT